MRVLVVDDEEGVRYALARYLIARGHQAVAAASGEAAMQLARGETFDAVISDCEMPGMCGPELFEKLVAFDSGYADRVIFMSGNRDDSDPRGFIAQAQRPFMRKPFSLFDLDAMLAALAPGAPRWTAIG